jgi:o-succinylbenzoate---CoA ligase
MSAAAEIPRWLARAARERPEHPAFVHAGRSVSHRELEARVRERAAQLAGAGLKAGERLAVLSPNAPAVIELIHAAMAVGATLVPLHARLHAAELSPLVEDARPRLLVCADGLADTARAAVSPTAETRVVDWSELCARPAVRAELQDAHPAEQDHAILFTSGTSGRPKGARLSYANQLASARASAQRLGAEPDDRWLLCMPLYHVGGLAIVLRSAIHAAALVLHDGFEPGAVARAIERDRLTQISLVPTMLARLLDAAPELRAPPGLRCVLLGGGPISHALLERARERGFPLAPSYGLTEAASQVATAQPGVGDGTALPPLPATELRIVGPDGAPQPSGVAGEICVRGPQVMLGYLDRPEASARALRDGWLHTGDVGELDARGHLRVLDRRDDLIVSGGENVYPAEVEAALLAHPEVAEAGVVGLPDAEWGQRVVAIVVPRRPPAEALERELLAHCAGALARFKRPRELRFASALPRTASGKLQRVLLRRRVAEHDAL